MFVQYVLYESLGVKKARLAWLKIKPLLLRAAGQAHVTWNITHSIDNIQYTWTGYREYIQHRSGTRLKFWIFNAGIVSYQSTIFGILLVEIIFWEEFFSEWWNLSNCQKYTLFVLFALYHDLTKFGLITWAVSTKIEKTIVFHSNFQFKLSVGRTKGWIPGGKNLRREQYPEWAWNYNSKA